MAECIVRFRGACALAPHKSMGADVLSVLLPDGETQHEYEWTDSAGGKIKATTKPHHAALLLPLDIKWDVTRGPNAVKIEQVIQGRVRFPPSAGAAEHGVIYLDRQHLAFNQTGGVDYGKFAGLGKVAATLNPKVITDTPPPSSVRARVRLETGTLKGDVSEGASTAKWTIHEPGKPSGSEPQSYFIGAKVAWKISSPLTLTLSSFAGGDALTFSVGADANVVIFVRNLEFPHVIGSPARPDPCDPKHPTPDFDFALLYELQKGNDSIAVPHPDQCDEGAAPLKAGGGKAARCMVGYYAQ